MTILEALRAAVQVPGIDDSALLKSCIDIGKEPSSDYTSSDRDSVNTAALNVLKTLVVTAESEGGYSYSISAAAIQKRIDLMEGKTDGPDRTIQRANVW